MLPEQSGERQLKTVKAKSGRDTFCDTPIAKGKVTFPDKLAGRANTNFDMYSGYVNISSSPDYLFYWFFGTQVCNYYI